MKIIEFFKRPAPPAMRFFTAMALLLMVSAEIFYLQKQVYAGRSEIVRTTSQIRDLQNSVRRLQLKIEEDRYFRAVERYVNAHDKALYRDLKVGAKRLLSDEEIGYVPPRIFAFSAWVERTKTGLRWHIEPPLLTAEYLKWQRGE